MYMAGIGFIGRKWSSSANHFLPITLAANRVLHLRLDSNRTLKVIQDFVSTMVSSEDKVEEFYDELESGLNNQTQL